MLCSLCEEDEVGGEKCWRADESERCFGNADGRGIDDSLWGDTLCAMSHVQSMIYVRNVVVAKTNQRTEVEVYIGVRTRTGFMLETASHFYTNRVVVMSESSHAMNRR